MSNYKDEGTQLRLQIKALMLDCVRSTEECSSNAQGLLASFHHSHSIVPGGLLVISYTTRLTPCTSSTMR